MMGWRGLGFATPLASLKRATSAKVSAAVPISSIVPPFAHIGLRSASYVAFQSSQARDSSGFSSWSKLLSVGVAGAGLSIGLAPTSICEEVSSEVVKEPHTKEAFPPERDEGRLLGVAVRCMLGQCKWEKARAYAVGLYSQDRVDGSAWQSDYLQTTKAVLASENDLTLVLRFSRDVRGEHVGKGFDRSLVPKMRKAFQGVKKNPGKEHLRQFTRCFNKVPMFKKGREVVMTWKRDGMLVISFDGVEQCQIPSPQLCECLFDIYLGESSIFTKKEQMNFNLPKCEKN